jgi:hypothetical protein
VVVSPAQRDASTALGYGGRLFVAVLAGWMLSLTLSSAALVVDFAYIQPRPEPGEPAADRPAGSQPR